MAQLFFSNFKYKLQKVMCRSCAFKFPLPFINLPQDTRGLKDIRNQICNLSTANFSSKPRLHNPVEHLFLEETVASITQPFCALLCCLRLKLVAFTQYPSKCYSQYLDQKCKVLWRHKDRDGVLDSKLYMLLSDLKSRPLAHSLVPTPRTKTSNSYGTSGVDPYVRRSCLDWSETSQSQPTSAQEQSASVCTSST